MDAKRKHYSFPELLLSYMHLQYPQRESFSVGELWDNQHEAQQYYWDNLPFDPEKRTAEIVGRHGFGYEQWKEVLSNSSSWRFLPSPQEMAANREIKKEFQKYPHIHQVARQRNYLSAVLRDQLRRKRPNIGREQIDGQFYWYLLNKINPIKQ